MTGPIRTLADLFWHTLTPDDPQPRLSFRVDSQIKSFTSQKFADRVLSCATRLEELGLRRGDRLAILSENRPEWHIVDFACHLLGLIVVPVYPTLSAARVRYQLRHSGAAAVFVSSAKFAESVGSVAGELPELRHILSPDELMAATPVESARLRAQSRLIAPEEVATIIYTSGTTGDPKGVMLTHANLVFNIYSTKTRMELRLEPRQAMAVLPLAHIFERSLCYSYFFERVPIAYGDPHELVELLPLFRPTVLACVPRILEKVHEKVISQVAVMPAWKQSLVRELMQAGYDQIGDALLHREPKAYARWLYPLADRLLFAKLREKMGGRIQFIISGGAALKASTAEFFYAAGIPVIEGYGLSETSPVIAVNPEKGAKLGTVGPPVPGAEVKISSDGELLVRGGLVMKGYWQNPTATAEALRDGWFHTGDLARIDEDGYLSIIGRKKELIVTSTGKKVSHVEIEELLAKSPLIQSAVLIGDNRRFVTAFLVPSRAEAERRGLPAEDSPELREALRQELETLQRELSEYERVQSFLILREEVLQDPEFLTPTQKLRRKNLEQHYAAAIEELYRS